jgi:ATP-dependent Clp protease ATP-binding subunit ClpA
LTHWIHQIWQLNDSDLHRICRHYQIDFQVVEKDLISRLSELPSGATSLSDFSHHVEVAIERAWILSSLEFGDRVCAVRGCLRRWCKRLICGGCSLACRPRSASSRSSN